MTNKFKIGDIVVCSDICSDIKEYPWYHKNEMKIIELDSFYYYTDYWHKDKVFTEKHFGIYGLGGGITEECLDYSIKEIRKNKLKKLQI